MPSTITCPHCGEDSPRFGSRCAYCGGDLKATKAHQAAPGGPLEPGWYADPSMAQTRRYWNGEKWTDHLAPSDGRTRTGFEVPTKLAWIVALLPIPAGLLIGLLPVGGLIVYVAASALVARRDQQDLEDRGVEVFQFWVLVPLIYLVVRAVKTRSSAWLPVVCVFALVVGGVLAAVVDGA